MTDNEYGSVCVKNSGGLLQTVYFETIKDKLNVRSSLGFYHRKISLLPLWILGALASERLRDFCERYILTISGKHSTSLHLQ